MSVRSAAAQTAASPPPPRNPPITPPRDRKTFRSPQICQRVAIPLNPTTSPHPPTPLDRRNPHDVSPPHPTMDLRRRHPLPVSPIVNHARHAHRRPARHTPPTASPSPPTRRYAPDRHHNAADNTDRIDCRDRHAMHPHPPPPHTTAPPHPPTPPPTFLSSSNTPPHPHHHHQHNRHPHHRHRHRHRHRHSHHPHHRHPEQPNRLHQHHHHHTPPLEPTHQPTNKQPPTANPRYPLTHPQPTPAERPTQRAPPHPAPPDNADDEDLGRRSHGHGSRGLFPASGAPRHAGVDRLLIGGRFTTRDAPLFGTSRTALHQTTATSNDPRGSKGPVRRKSVGWGYLAGPSHSYTEDQ
ncbi:hypothetical protein C9F11_42005 [Streptomyces sp. YIM 121038]|nr:hypothetical protein C9F11_42005 [Streptomyces sp. YIM 121038]